MAKSLKESPNSGTYLPSELIFLILVRFPVKCLLQLKLVCSVWRTIISGPRFIKAHLDMANDVHDLSFRRYISNSQMNKSIGLKNRDTRYEHTVPVTDFSSDVEILGSCNGLLLLGDNDRDYYLWNPSTGLLRNFNGPPLFRKEFRNFALGCDSTSNAYKVIRIVRVTSHKVGFRPPEHTHFYYDATSARVYNCKTDCWKKIKNFPYVIFDNAHGIIMNGCPHWVVFRDHHGEDKVIDLAIIYFDLAEEKFKEIPKPNWLVRTSLYEFGVFEGQLCFIHYTKGQNEVWVMKKHGEESWIDLSSVVDINSVCLAGWSTGHRIEDRLDPDAFAKATYVESLVSPHGGNDMIG